MTVEHKKVNFFHASLVCFAAGVYFLYEFALQISPGIMTTDLMRDLSIDAVGIGIISGTYYLTYTFMQVPAGLLYDRFGPRVLLTFASLICAAGAFAFGLTSGVFGASAGRFLMGVGSAFAFIGCLVLIARWFPPAYFALLAGCVQLMGSAGTLIGEMPLAASVETFGWRHTIIVTAIVGILVAVFIWIVVRDNPNPEKHEEHHLQKGEMKRLASICKNKQTWLIGIYAFTSWAPILVFAGLWAVPYLMELYHINATEASAAVSMVWISVAIGSPLVGWWSDRVGKRCFPLAICSIAGLIASIIILYVPDVPFSWMFPVLFVFGFAASAQTLSFALIKDNNHPSTVGTAIGFNNMMVVSGGLLFQPLVGYLLSVVWSGEVVDNVPVYTSGNYQTALFVLPLCFAVGCLLSWKFLKESNCEPTYLVHGRL